ncbi:MAG: DnaJ domain-containing protein [Planctomycetia bacterium]|nr:DnaJ domain-containing protein [Planctomycetia bacterium]
MFPDYYAILGVALDADAETIRRAYKRRAFECHPDRGGSHEQMIRINAAWEILSDPLARQRYDHARTHAHDPVAAAAANEDSRTACERAERYPRQWSEFEVWLEDVTKDFARAQYGKVEVFGATWPVVSGSGSGKSFAVAGGLVGLFVGVWLNGTNFPVLWGGWSWDQLISQRTVAIFSAIFFTLIGFPSVGAYLGAQIHKGIGVVLKSAMRAGSNSTAVVKCSQCGQQLRVPNSSGKWQIRCPKCSHSFIHISMNGASK